MNIIALIAFLAAVITIQELKIDHLQTTKAELQSNVIALKYDNASVKFSCIQQKRKESLLKELSNEHSTTKVATNVGSHTIKF